MSMPIRLHVALSELTPPWRGSSSLSGNLKRGRPSRCEENRYTEAMSKMQLEIHKTPNSKVLRSRRAIAKWDRRNGRAAEGEKGSSGSWGRESRQMVKRLRHCPHSFFYTKFRGNSKSKVWKASTIYKHYYVVLCNSQIHHTILLGRRCGLKRWCLLQYLISWARQSSSEPYLYRGIHWLQQYCCTESNPATVQFWPPSTAYPILDSAPRPRSLGNAPRAAIAKLHTFSESHLQCDWLRQQGFQRSLGNIAKGAQPIVGTTVWEHGLGSVALESDLQA